MAEQPTLNAAQIAEINRQVQEISLRAIREMGLRKWAVELALKERPGLSLDDTMAWANMIFEFVSDEAD